MSLFKKYTRQGNALVERDENNRVVRVVKGHPALPVTKNWRRLVREATDDGYEMFTILMNIARGSPFKVQNPDDPNAFSWETPTVEVQRQAAKDVIEFLHGKAVAQTEVVNAEKEAEDLAQLTALTDEQLADAARPFLERVRKGVPLLASDDEKGDE